MTENVLLNGFLWNNVTLYFSYAHGPPEPEPLTQLDTHNYQILENTLGPSHVHWV